MFPQIRLTTSSGTNTVDINMNEAFDPTENYKHIFKQEKLYYEGFIVLFDKGYQKSMYVNSYIPINKMTNKPFFLSTTNKDSWIYLLVKALAKYFGSYHALSQASFEDLCETVFGHLPIEINNEFCKDNIYRYGINKTNGTSHPKKKQEANESDLYKLYLWLSSLMRKEESHKTIVVLKKKAVTNDPFELPRFVSKGMVDHLANDGFFDGFHYVLDSITDYDGEISRVKIVSNLKKHEKFGNSAITCSLQQMQYLFELPQILMHPLEVPRTLCITSFTPSISRKLYCFIFLFKVDFTSTAAQLNIALQTKDP
jgi:hypothetical protein